MCEDRLKMLFDEADAAPGLPRTSPGEFADHVLSLYERRQKHRIRALTVASIIMLGALVWLSSHGRHGVPLADGLVSRPSNSRPVVSTVEIAEVKSQLAHAYREIEREQRIVERLLAAERRVRLTAAAGQMEVALERPAVAAEQVGRAALAVLVGAEQKRGRIGLTASVQESYTRVIDLFPDTPWADEARQRLTATSP